MHGRALYGKQIHPTLPCSNYCLRHDGEKERSVKASADDFITKPSI